MSKKGDNIRGFQISYEKSTPNFLKQFKHQEDEKVAEKERARERKRVDNFDDEEDELPTVEADEELQKALKEQEQQKEEERKKRMEEAKDWMLQQKIQERRSQGTAEGQVVANPDAKGITFVRPKEKKAGNVVSTKSDSQKRKTDESEKKDEAKKSKTTKGALSFDLDEEED